jgi:hypothetical protein
MDLRNILKNIGINLLAFLSGGIIGLVISFLYAIYIVLPSLPSSVGLGIIALIPALLIIYGLIGIFIGGILGIILYHIRKRKKNKPTRK